MISLVAGLALARSGELPVLIHRLGLPAHVTGGDGFARQLPVRSPSFLHRWWWGLTLDSSVLRLTLVRVLGARSISIR